MATNSYIRILTAGQSETNPNAGLRFRVIQGGYQEVINKAGSEEPTAGGGLDVCQGAVRVSYMHTVRVRHTEPLGSLYGTLQDLKDLFSRNNPNGTNSNVLRLVDHFDNVHTGFLVRQLQVNPVTTIIEGEDAWFVIQIAFVETEAA